MAKEKNYSKRELDTAFNSITDHLKSQDGTLEKIYIQTTKTNGRVSKLEYWRNAIIWTIGILAGFTPLVVYFLSLKK